MENKLENIGVTINTVKEMMYIIMDLLYNNNIFQSDNTYEFKLYTLQNKMKSADTILCGASELLNKTEDEINSIVTKLLEEQKKINK